ncbi:bifunctional metallophosphatase/5'-nucleotidase [Nocardia macrotermitis]|uniref:Endonuclease YhcR n=1 Tax=Nocardia macrotermitis TaxID=2585198 RepID=A0A7K0CVJ9_9NOCA|nr:bifunctional UDP-sugar hydrolase/5'-nucleotidase [Nocardia macrotermitis]MQY17413.1 Endonuclease YhcR [Nocardia macrotermitis]
MKLRRRLIEAMIAVIGVVLMVSCGGHGTAPSNSPHANQIPLVSTDDLPAAQPGEVHLFGINDLHGNLEPPDGSNGHVGAYQAGGAAYLATHLAKLKAAYPAGAVLSAGDNVSASPLISALFHDEPTIDYLNSLGVSASAVGNHEFDHGTAELTRLQQGGCAADGCSPGQPFTGAAFPYLASNVTDVNGQLPPGLKPWTMLTVGGHKIGVVGTVTRATADIVMPDAIRGYSFGDEADAVNKYVPEMVAAGAETVVALVHDGGAQQTHGAAIDYNGCTNISPNVTILANRIDPRVKVVFTAHTHLAYNCVIGGKVVTQAASYGRLITDVSLRFHDGTVDAKAVNRVVTRTVTPDPAAAKLVAFYSDQARPRAAHVIGTTAGPLSNEPTPGGDSPLGDVIADAMLAAMAPDHAVAAFMNPGGVRADLSTGAITYEQAYTVQPFGNQVVTVALSGEQILNLLEQQWDNKTTPGVLSVAGITYSYSDAAPKGHKILDDTVRIAGQALNPAAVYQVSTNNFLAAGGDGFSVFTKGQQNAVGPADLDAFNAYLASQAKIEPPASRVQRR